MTGLFFLLMNGTTGAKQRTNERMLWCDVVGAGGRGQAEIAGAARRDAVAASGELFLLLLPHLSRSIHTVSHHFCFSESHFTLGLCDIACTWFSYFPVFLYPFRLTPLPFTI